MYGLVCLSLLAAVTGCSLVGRADPPAADLSGTYEGVLRLDGEDMPTTVTVTQTNGRVDAALTSTVGLSADGRGTLQGTVLRIDFDYGDDCSGTMKLAGQALDQGQRLVGTMEVQDCTGPAEGSFSFARR